MATHIVFTDAVEEEASNPPPLSSHLESGVLVPLMPVTSHSFSFSKHGEQLPFTVSGKHGGLPSTNADASTDAHVVAPLGKQWRGLLMTSVTPSMEEIYSTGMAELVTAATNEPSGVVPAAGEQEGAEVRNSMPRHFEASAEPTATLSKYWAQVPQTSPL